MSPRRPSFPDTIAPPESVYQTIWEHDARLDTIETKVDSIAEDVKDAVREIKLSNSSETRKLIAAIAGAVITMIGGIFGAAKLERPAAPPAIQRSALDMRLDECRPIHEPGTRAECFNRVYDGVQPK